VIVHVVNVAAGIAFDPHRIDAPAPAPRTITDPRNI
jgi:hypothetical protein